ncbi:MAG: hypothetical protein U0Q07_18500 [Acidimicrobiales bacterium]
MVLVVSAGPALAHGPTGIFQPQPGDTRVVGPLQLSFRTRLIYANDTEPITKDATVTIQGTGPGGSVGPVRMSYAGSDGYYVGTVTFPAAGTWHLQYQANWPWLNVPPGPQAQYAFDQPVSAPPTTPPPTAPPPTAGPQPTAPPVTATPGGAAPVTPAPTTTSTAAAVGGDLTTTTTASADSTTTEATGTSTTAPPAPSNTATPTTGELATSAITDQPSGGSGPLWALVAGGVVVAGGIAAAVVVLSGRRTPPAG